MSFRRICLYLRPKLERSEGDVVPFFIAKMDMQSTIRELVEEKIDSTDNFLVEIKIRPASIAVIIDHPEGVKIDDCVMINRYLHEKLDGQGLLDKYEVEVGSPGIEEPLKILPQYRKNVGRTISVVTYDGLKHAGRLASVADEGIELETEKSVKTGGKKEIQKNRINIPFSTIKETRVILSFDKIIGSK